VKGKIRFLKRGFIFYREGREVESFKAELYQKKLDQIWNKVVTILGPMTTSVILKRVISQTQYQYPFLKSLEVNEEGISFNHLKIKKKKELEEGFESFMNNLFDKLTNLTGDVLIGQIKRELEKL